MNSLFANKISYENCVFASAVTNVVFLGAPFSSDGLRLMRSLRRFAPEQLAELRLPTGPLQEVDRALRAAILHLYGREPKSRSFLDEVSA